MVEQKHHQEKMNYYLTTLFLLSVGLFFTIVGIVLTFTWPYLFDLILRSQLSLSPNSKSFELWKKNPLPMNLDFYFFNWTNIEELNNPFVKPNFEQVSLPFGFLSEFQATTDIFFFCLL